MKFTTQLLNPLCVFMCVCLYICVGMHEIIVREVERNQCYY